MPNSTWSTGDTSQQISIDTPGIFWVDIQTQYCGTKRDEVRYKFLKTTATHTSL